MPVPTMFAITMQVALKSETLCVPVIEGGSLTPLDRLGGVDQVNAKTSAYRQLRSLLVRFRGALRMSSGRGFLLRAL